jgi:hypothetical protein
VPEPTQTAVIGGEDDCQEDCLAKEIPGVRLPDSKPAPALPALIGTVTQSRAGCALEIVAEPIPSDARRLRLVNEMNRWVSFNVVRLESVRLFAQLEAIVANDNYTPFADRQPTGAFSLGPRAVGPGASGTFTDYGATPGGAYAVVCFDREHFPGGLYPLPHGGHFAVVGPIVVR